MKAVWNGVTLAESNETVVVEGNNYFPPQSIKSEYLKESDHTTVCSWKGTANYMDIVTPDGKELKNAVFIYKSPSDRAAHIKDHMAF